MPARGVSFARYIRAVHVEWCPFKPRAVGPVFFGEMHTKKIMDSVKGLTVTKAILAKPATAEEHVDRAKLTFVDKSERTIDFAGMTLRDVLEEIDSESVRISQEERKRGKAFT